MIRPFTLGFIAGFLTSRAIDIWRKVRNEAYRDAIAHKNTQSPANESTYTWVSKCSIAPHEDEVTNKIKSHCILIRVKEHFETRCTQSNRDLLWYLKSIAASSKNKSILAKKITSIKISMPVVGEFFVTANANSVLTKDELYELDSFIVTEMTHGWGHEFTEEFNQRHPCYLTIYSPILTSSGVFHDNVKN